MEGVVVVELGSGGCACAGFGEFGRFGGFADLFFGDLVRLGLVLD